MMSHASASRRAALAAMPLFAVLDRGVAAEPAKLRIGTGAEGAASSSTAPPSSTD